jgi:hypothetical protein
MHTTIGRRAHARVQARVQGRNQAEVVSAVIGVVHVGGTLADDLVTDDVS